MASPNEFEFRTDEKQAATNGNRPKAAAQEQSNGPAFVAYIFIVPREKELSLDILRTLLTQEVSRNSAGFPAAEQHAPTTADSWLPHPAAAEYLGISESTLYRYAGQGRIETRKLGGRLEYRHSVLNQFKEQHIRPTRRSRNRGTIAPMLLGSGN
jgi:excisionase family DNA binding protein